MATEYLTTSQAAGVLELSERRVRALCEAGHLGRKIGRNWAISRAQVKRFHKLDRPAHRPPKAV